MSAAASDGQYKCTYACYQRPASSGDVFPICRCSGSGRCSCEPRCSSLSQRHPLLACLLLGWMDGWMDGWMAWAAAAAGPSCLRRCAALTADEAKLQACRRLECDGDGGRSRHRAREVGGGARCMAIHHPRWAAAGSGHFGVRGWRRPARHTAPLRRPGCFPWDRAAARSVESQTGGGHWGGGQWARPSHRRIAKVTCSATFHRLPDPACLHATVLLHAQG